MFVAAGRHYKQRNGNIVGPLNLTPLNWHDHERYVFCLQPFAGSPTWSATGEYAIGTVSDYDLIEEHILPEKPAKLICDVTLEDLRRGIANMHPHW